MPHLGRSHLLASLLALGLGSGFVQAAATPSVATVTQVEAEVRCKPGTKAELYPTNRLRQGTRVLVFEDRNDGWLAIQPPPGSFSWIDGKQVERIAPAQANWVVKTDGVPVLIGSELVRERPTVEGVHLARGAQVRVIGQEEKDGATSWLPIDPPPGEMRYILASAVSARTPLLADAAPATPAANVVAEQPKPANAFAAVRTVASPGGPVGQTASLSIPAQAPPAVSPTASPWEKAAYFERQGQWVDAIGVYEQLSRDLQRTNPPWSNFAYQRAAYLRNGGRTPLNLTAPQQPAGDLRYSTFQPAVQTPQPVSASPQARLSPPTDPATNRTASWSSPQPNAAATAANGPGRLVRSWFKVAGAPVYRLETVNGFVYVTPGPGVDLEGYVDRNIEVFGTTQYSGELRVNYMTVSRVQAN